VCRPFFLRRSAMWLLLAGFALLGAACGKTPISSDGDSAADKEAQVQAGEVRLSGPYTHDNLTIYLIHGEDKLKDKNLLTLDEALEQKKVVIHETKQVNELAIENVSDEEVFVQSGDIIKGGQQDRVIASDLIVSAKSGKLPLNAFCVEHDRWHQRGGEVAYKFSKCDNTCPSNSLKMAVRRSADQAKVWKEVENAQANLGAKVGGSVRSGASATS
jgi:hypothetical protein